MCFFFLLFSWVSIIHLTISYDFTLSTSESKLITWTNPNNNNLTQQLLLSQVEIVQKTVLIQKLVLPFSYIIDENCIVSESLSKATIYQPYSYQQIHLEYSYLSGSSSSSSIVSKDKVYFTSTSNGSINLNNGMQIVISSEAFLSQQTSSSSSNVQSITTNSQDMLLYMYNNQTLVSFNSRVYSHQAACYMLSPMTNELCMSQQCLTLSPEQVYNMQIGIVIKNYSIINGQIMLQPTSSNDIPANKMQQKQVYLRLETLLFNQAQTEKQLQNVTQQVVAISGQTIIKVNFQLQQIDTTNTTNITAAINTASSLRVQSSLSINQQIQSYRVKITLTNSQPVFAIKTIKLFLGEQFIESDQVIFKPLQQLTYSLIWNNDQSQIPAVQIYSQNLTLQNRYSMNNYVDFQYNQQTLLMKNSPALSNNIVQTETLQQVSTTESHGQKFPLIIILAATGGSLFVIFTGVCFFRKRIFGKCYRQSEKQEPQQKQQTQVKKEPQNQNIQSSKYLKDHYDLFTFENKESLFTQTPSVISKITQNKAQNPQQSQQNQDKNQCSISGQLPEFTRQQKIQDKDQPITTTDTLPDSKIMTPSRSDQSLSLTSNFSKSHSKKPLTKKDNKKSQQEQQTQNV